MKIDHNFIDSIKNNIEELDSLGYELFGVIAELSSFNMFLERIKEEVCENDAEALYSYIQNMINDDYFEYGEEINCPFTKMLYECPKDEILDFMPNTNPIIEAEDKIIKLIVGETKLDNYTREVLIDFLKEVILAYRHKKLIQECKEKYDEQNGKS